VTAALLISFLAAPAAEARVKKSKIKRKTASVGRTGIPLLPDGSPDYSKFPNPFVVKKWNFDAGAAGGARNGTGYSEYGLAANAYFYDWLAWRNSVYMRAGENGKRNFGFDTSERFVYEIGRSGFSLFAAPGFRFGGALGNAPFAEAGAILELGPVAVGGGARELFASWTRTAAGNETQVFVSIFAGGFP
jgi:hypothetical protein